MMSAPRVGKYFVIRSKQFPHLVLQIEDGQDRPETAVIAAESLGDAVLHDSHLWFVDKATATIRSKLNNFCFDIADELVIVNPYTPGKRNQNWLLNGERIVHQSETDRIIEVAEQTAKGARCQTAKYKEIDEQHWSFEHQIPFYFYIRSQSDQKLVFDIAKAESKPGAKVIVFESKGDLADHQLWYEDEDGIIRSKLNGFVLDATGKEISMSVYNKDNGRQHWILNGAFVENRLHPNDVLHTKAGSTIFNNPILYAGPRNENMSCRWIFDMVQEQHQSLSHSGCGKHFTLRSRASGLVLEVQGKIIESGTPIITAHLTKDSSRASRQHFYVDDVTGTIRNVLRNYCIEVRDDNLVLSPYNPYNKNQQWQVCGKKIQNRHNLNLVLEVCDGSSSPGDKVRAAEYTGDDKQHWETNNVPAKCFFIVSQMNEKVIDVRGDVASAGTEVIMYDRKSTVCPNQLWYEDENGILRSKLNGYVFDTTEGSAKLRPHNPSNRSQQWIIVGDRIQNKFDSKLVIDITREISRNGASLGPYKYPDSSNQKWKFDYA